jgi:predicted transcriptional regulator
MPKTLINARLDDDLVAWMDAYAKERGWTRTLVIGTALANLRADALGGVPEASRPMVGQTSLALSGPGVARDDAKAAEFARRPTITPEKAALFAEGKLPLSD